MQAAAIAHHQAAAAVRDDLAGRHHPVLQRHRAILHHPHDILARYAAAMTPRHRARLLPCGLTRRLLRCSLASGPVFVTAFLLEGAVRDGYRPLRHPVSSLALGSRGWVQAANFAVTGTLFLAWRGRAVAGFSDPALGTRRGPALIGAAGAGLIGAGVFPTDPVSGYPPGTPGAPRAPSRTGTVHNLAAIPVFLWPASSRALLQPCGRSGGRATGFELYSSLSTAITMLATMALAAAGFGQAPQLVNLGGLFQRASIMTGFTWLTVLSARALRLTRYCPARPAASGLDLCLPPATAGRCLPRSGLIFARLPATARCGSLAAARAGSSAGGARTVTGAAEQLDRTQRHESGRQQRLDAGRVARCDGRDGKLAAGDGACGHHGQVPLRHLPGGAMAQARSSPR